MPLANPYVVSTDRKLKRSSTVAVLSAAKPLWLKQLERRQIEEEAQRHYCVQVGVIFL